jgi:hypothetical protein
VIERACEIEQIVAVNNSFDARTFAARLEQLDCVAACQIVILAAVAAASKPLRWPTSVATRSN